MATATLAAAPPPAPPAHDWRLVGGRHWQIVSTGGEDVEARRWAEGTRGSCPAGMIDVRGKMKLAAFMDELQKVTCTKWINRNFPERCAEFDREKWLKASKDLPTREMRFCIDRFEYPNRRGEFPVILVNWHEAGELCKKDNKRLCTEDEWTFACEGEEARPYPYGDGFVRDAGACVVDHGWRAFNGSALSPRDGQNAMRELDRLWQGERSGARSGCKSVFGVYDMTGNIDEWTRSSQSGRPSILKGGYWGPVRTRCRPSTRAHGETHAFYQQGVRCCTDAR